METAGVEPAPPRCKRGVLPEGPRPRGCDPAATRPASGIFALGIHFRGSRACGQVQCGRVESNHHSRGPRGYSPLSSPVLGVRTEWRGWDSNPRSRAHEARGDSRSPTALRALCARRDRSGRLESNQRSPVPETGGMAKLPHSQVQSTTVESNHACPLHQSGACPAGPSSSVAKQPFRDLRRRQGIAPCSTGSRPAGSLLALRRSLAGRIRTPVGHGRSVVLVH